MGFGNDKTGFYKPSAVTVTASGNPLTLQNAKRLRKLTIYGNAVQDGTPSPDAPVEVQLCGDRTGNLLDYDVFDNAPEYISDLSSIGCFAISVPNGAYTMSTNIEIKNNLNAGAFLIANSLPDTITSPLYGVSLNNPRTVTVSNGTLYVCIYWRNAGTGATYPHVFTKEDFTSGTYWLMLVQGSYTADTLPAYEPYGYKVSGRAEGLNLFDLDNASDENNWSYSAAKDHAYYDIPDVGIGNKYTVCLKLKTPIEISSVAVVMNSISKVNKTVINLKSADRQIKTLIYEEGDCFDIYSPGTNGAFKILQTFVNSDIAIYKGSYTAETMPPYEPYQPPQDFAVYLPEQIAKVGDVADEVAVDMESKTAELRKNIIQDTFTGDDGWYTNAEATDTQRYFAPVDSSLKVNNGINVLCTHLVRGISAPNFGLNTCWLQSFSNGTAWFGICVDTATYPDVNSFEAFVSQQYNSGHALSIYHAIEPVTTDITSLQQWDAMPQVSGTVTLTLSAEVEPSGAEAVYTASKRPKAQAALIEENTIPEDAVR